MPQENFSHLHFSDRWKCTVESTILVFSCCLLREPRFYYGQHGQTYRPTIHLLTGESPEETRKLVAHEQIEHWPKFSASEGTKLIRNS